ncbi:hypothetical protein EYC84_011855 [Monilinia fructicola]|uniref:Uncharacterized protein n=1 Tax=Monilinia fructicola TaxID=38448 RepID=A0A5M9J611_MONFR|nr:hypothetical protein EYC84_011855 [Monilinia fructicola]
MPLICFVEATCVALQELCGFSSLSYILSGTEMLAADNIIDITFGVASVFLTTVTICLMCKQHKSREIDMENGIDHEVKSIVPHPEPVSIPIYEYMRSWPAESGQTAESLPSVQRPDITPAHPYYAYSRIPRVQHQTPPQHVQPGPNTMEFTTVSEFPDSHIYYHSLRTFLSNEPI